ncbi:MAG: hypothetical protein N4A70_06850 [Pelagimonas sp.]|nr:hypothetical protein [Pelagimonas sp.]
MGKLKTQISAVRYNAAESRFEALVTFHGDFGRHSVPASSAAPLTAEFDQITDDLLRDALAQLSQPGTLSAHLATPAASGMAQDMPAAA